MAASFHDGSPLRPLQLGVSVMEVHSFVEMRTGGRRDIPSQQLQMDDTRPGIWHMKIDLKTLLGMFQTCLCMLI